MKTIKTIREATSAGDIAQLDRQIQPIFDRLMNAADTLEKELKRTKKMSKVLDSEVTGGKATKDYKKALKMTGQILDILDDIEMEWNLYYDYNK